MGPRTKYEDTIYEKVVYSGKIFIYNSPTWDVLFPIVDIIRLLKNNTIIGFKYDRGQQNIRTYGSQYNHCVLGCELKNKNDYITNLKTVKNIFIFSDTQDTTATNLMNTAKKNKINVICYSNLDAVYHFYHGDETFTIKTPQEVIYKMYYLNDLNDVKQIADLFPEFEIIEPVAVEKNTTLEECMDLFKKAGIEEKREKEKNFVKAYDPHMGKIKHMENERSQRNTVYPDSVENLVKIENNKHRSLLSRFFNKPKI